MDIIIFLIISRQSTLLCHRTAIPNSLGIPSRMGAPFPHFQRIPLDQIQLQADPKCSLELFGSSLFQPRDRESRECLHPARVGSRRECDPDWEFQACAGGWDLHEKGLVGEISGQTLLSSPSLQTCSVFLDTRNVTWDGRGVTGAEPGPGAPKIPNPEIYSSNCC